MVLHEIEAPGNLEMVYNNQEKVTQCQQKVLSVESMT